MTATVFVVALALLGASVATTKQSSAPASSAEGGSSVRGFVLLDFAGTGQQRQAVHATFTVSSGSNAWAALRQALGAENVGYVDYGGSLGVMVTSLYGVPAQGNHFWEFVVNGESASVGVGGYIVQEGDRLEFRYSSF
ncbi:MAG TPA: DUF4430 domain-containing protein [Dehalococcoidia bacterium]|nr:DUF4430 domain-containing protein [Dehalococcoidia bacterium]